jgi:hypothetical protein
MNVKPSIQQQKLPIDKLPLQTCPIDGIYSLEERKLH